MISNAFVMSTRKSGKTRDLKKSQESCASIRNSKLVARGMSICYSCCCCHQCCFVHAKTEDEPDANGTLSRGQVCQGALRDDSCEAP